VKDRINWTKHFLWKATWKESRKGYRSWRRPEKPAAEKPRGSVDEGS